MLVHIVYLYTLHVYTLCICMKHGSKIGISECKLECRIKFDQLIRIYTIKIM